MNIFATALTYPAPSANYRGESELNRAIIQRVTDGRFEYSIVSPEAMRNALREMLAAYGLPLNRERLGNEEQLAVRFQDYPYPEKYVDDFLFGYLVADRKQIPADVVRNRDFQFKRDSVLRMNLAKALEPFRHDALLTQSPLTMRSPWQNATASAFELGDDRPVVDGTTRPDGSAYANQGEQRKHWLRHLLRAISELNGVAGNHARSYFEMAPDTSVR